MLDLDRHHSDCGFILVSNQEPYGAADAVDGALLIKPFVLDGLAACTRAALEIERGERRQRIRRRRVQLHEATIFDWLVGIPRRADLMEEPAREPAK